jgi:4-aminobutyrate aminotransferase/(S)-3-amino-2-methylpropionate transaminase
MGSASCSPVYVTGAGGGIVVDADGNSLIDLGSGIAVTTVGNANTYVAAGVAEQVAAFAHTCFMVTPYLGYVEVCEALNRLTPGDHAKRSALFNSGAEAVENAVKSCQAGTPSGQAVVVFEHGYHGRTNLTMGLTAKNMPYKEGVRTLRPRDLPGAHLVPVPRPRAFTAPRWLPIAVTRIEKEIGAHNVAAILFEPMPGRGRLHRARPGFMPALAEFANRNGIVFIADEIQSGFCRTGAVVRLPSTRKSSPT